MNGYMFVLCHCIACKKQIAINPFLCPSLRVNDKREPLCKDCALRWHEIHNVEPNIHPQAYEATEIC